MAHKKQLRKNRAGTVINTTSKKQEKALDRAISRVIKKLKETYPAIEFEHKKDIELSFIIHKLTHVFPEVDFSTVMTSSSMRPDGGILYIKSLDGECFPILITEKKNQGTNDMRLLEGKKKQAKGNAIERLGKNVIGLRTYLLTESIFPFVCFGDGCDFAEESSIIDRVKTIAMYGELNKVYLHNVGPFARGTFYFRVV